MNFNSQLCVICLASKTCNQVLKYSCDYKLTEKTLRIPIFNGKLTSAKADGRGVGST